MKQLRRRVRMNGCKCKKVRSEYATDMRSDTPMTCSERTFERNKSLAEFNFILISLAKFFFLASSFVAVRHAVYNSLCH